jgi:ribonuclease P protein component
LKTEGFRKQERIVSTRLIETLFSGSQSMAAFPLRVVFRTIPRLDTGVPVQILISVPKKRFKHAVDRNRVKRQVREAFRHHRQPLCNAIHADSTLLMGFIWMSDRHATTDVINASVEKLLSKIASSL